MMNTEQFLCMNVEEELKKIKDALELTEELVYHVGIPEKELTFEKLLQIAREKCSDPRMQVIYMKGYLKGVGFVMGHMGSIERSIRTVGKRQTKMNTIKSLLGY